MELVFRMASVSRLLALMSSCFSRSWRLTEMNMAPTGCQSRTRAGHDGFHSLKAAIYLMSAVAAACDARHAFMATTGDYATAAIGPKSASNSSADA